VGNTRRVQWQSGRHAAGSETTQVDGLEVLKQIKSDAQLKMIPVVVLTSSKEEKDMVASYKLGVNAYVVKQLTFMSL